MRVLVIPEDFRKDQYMLKPVCEAMLAWLGKAGSKVVVLKDPLLGGIERALDRQQLQAICERYRGMIDLFLLCVDRDGNADRRARLDGIEAAARDWLPANKLLLAEHAWQEIEVWVLAGLKLPKAWDWQAIRAEPHPKERFFEPFAEKRGLSAGPGGGRRALGLEAARYYGQRIRQKCPEDVLALEARVQAFVGG